MSSRKEIAAAVRRGLACGVTASEVVDLVLGMAALPSAPSPVALKHLADLADFLESEMVAASQTDISREHNLMVWASELRGLLAKITGSGEEA